MCRLLPFSPVRCQGTPPNEIVSPFGISTGVGCPSFVPRSFNEVDCLQILLMKLFLPIFPEGSTDHLYHPIVPVTV